MRVEVQHDEGRREFYALVDGRRCFLAYGTLDRGTLEYKSTFVPEELRGQGIGQEVVMTALDWAQENGYRVVPSCSFVRQMIENHPRYKKMTASA